MANNIWRPVDFQSLEQQNRKINNVEERPSDPIVISDDTTSPSSSSLKSGKYANFHNYENFPFLNFLKIIPNLPPNNCSKV